ncbi:MAG: mannose-1-phosphate guanylyltransferase [Bacteroidales bacterium]|nr:mannose-1-phosphate guanylyltransferase [Bacteroidales bacterium]MCM1146753.1 mannose-1-phosphate guanylyltransferase [Bacteroidales bacterium]MCM1205570.1 mannose-1-phosphate guanylyltransferase [Bacillota bacterium]MCM1509168.1 mannose-1-phosphate guanylyltransferase [Clostridium sp.]
MNNNHLVIMAGGVGSRFWPMSTEETPKQFIDVLGVGKSLLQLTMQRFAGICAPENVWVVTNAAYVEKVHDQLPDIPRENILSEPCRRNTAPCICYVSWRIKTKNPKANIVVTPSDHIVTDTQEFQRVIKSALQFTSESDAIVTLGMKPTRPETGYGYIQADLSSNTVRNKEIFAVEQFREKPDLETAKEYVKHNNYFWNAGIFVWSASTIITAFRLYAPTINRIFEGLENVYGTDGEQAMIDKMYPECESISVDYAIMENAEDIYVQPSDFGWSDLGTWGSLWTLTKHDVNGNGCIGDNVRMIDSRNCIVHTMEEKQVVVQGLDGYIIAEKDDTLLICKLSEEQRIKNFHD